MSAGVTERIDHALADARHHTYVKVFTYLIRWLLRINGASWSGKRPHLSGTGANPAHQQRTTTMKQRTLNRRAQNPNIRSIHVVADTATEEGLMPYEAAAKAIFVKANGLSAYFEATGLAGCAD
jgi:hypothetical protein